MASQVKVSVPRIRRVRFKDGREISVIRGDAAQFDAEAIKNFRNLLEEFRMAGGVPDGCAIVVWDREGWPATAVNPGRGAVRPMLIPDFCRQALQVHTTARSL